MLIFDISNNFSKLYNGISSLCNAISGLCNGISSLCNGLLNNLFSNRLSDSSFNSY